MIPRGTANGSGPIAPSMAVITSVRSPSTPPLVLGSASAARSMCWSKSSIPRLLLHSSGKLMENISVVVTLPVLSNMLPCLTVSLHPYHQCQKHGRKGKVRCCDNYTHREL